MNEYVTKDQLRSVLQSVLEDVIVAITDGNCREICPVDTYMTQLPETRPEPSRAPDARVLLSRLEAEFTDRLQAKTSWGRNEVLVEFKHAVSEALFAFMVK